MNSSALSLLALFVAFVCFVDACKFSGRYMNDKPVLTSPFVYSDFLKRASTSRAAAVDHFDLTFDPAMTVQEQNAFTFAAEILSKHIDAPSNAATRIRVQVNKLNSASQHPVTFSITAADTFGFFCASSNPNEVVAPSQFLWENNGVDCVGTFHGRINFYESFDFYTGLDGMTPFNQYDMVTVAMHSLVHIMGFFTGIRPINSFTDNLENKQSPNIVRYDGHLRSSAGDVVTTSSSVPDGLTKSSDCFFEMDVSNPVSDPRKRLFCPPSYDAAVQLTHWENSIPGGPSEIVTGSNGLMKENLNIGAAVHQLGANTVDALVALGWPMRNCSQLTTCDQCIVSVACQWCLSSNTCGDPTGDVCASSADWINSGCPVSSGGGSGGGSSTSSTGTSGTTGSASELGSLFF